MTLPERVNKWRQRVSPVLDLLAFGIAVYVIDRILREYPPREILDAVITIPVTSVIAALVFTGLGYLALVGYDFIALRFVGRPLPLRTVLIPSFASFAVSKNAPASVVTGGGVRYKLYQPLGLTLQEASVIAGFNVLTYMLGLFTVTGVAFVASQTRPLPARIVGGVMLLASAGYLLLARFRPGPLEVGPLHIRIPALNVALQQLGVSMSDWLLSSAALYVLLITLTPVPYIDFMTAFVVAQFSTLLLPIPGGIGVFEAIVLLLRPSGTPASYTLDALVLYRVIYYLLPLFVTAPLLGVRWLGEVRRSGSPARQIREQVTALAPRLLAWTTFLAGMLLLVSGVIPTNDRRLSWLARVLPLGVIEATHLLGSVVGALLVVLAWGLEVRSRLAYRIICALFGLGILLAAVRSLDYPLVVTLALALLVLIAAGRSFPPMVSITRTPMPPAWKAAIVGVLTGLSWVAVILYRHAHLGDQVWWRFALFGHAPRALRASVAAAVLILVAGLARLVAERANTNRSSHHSPNRHRDGG